MQARTCLVLRGWGSGGGRLEEDSRHADIFYSLGMNFSPAGQSMALAGRPLHNHLWVGQDAAQGAIRRSNFIAGPRQACSQHIEACQDVPESSVPLTGLIPSVSAGLF